MSSVLAGLGETALIIPIRAKFLTAEQWEAGDRVVGEWTWATRLDKRIGVIGATPDGEHIIWARKDGWNFHGSEDELNIISSPHQYLPWIIERGVWKRF